MGCVPNYNYWPRTGLRVCTGEVLGSSRPDRRERSIWGTWHVSQDGENRACVLPVGFPAPRFRLVRGGFAGWTVWVDPRIVDNSAGNGFSRASQISRVSNVSTIQSSFAFDKATSSSVTSCHLTRFGDSLDETHISTERAQTQQEARVPSQDADQSGPRRDQTSSPEGPEANRRLRRCTSRSGRLASFNKCFDMVPAAAAAESWSFMRPGSLDPHGSGSSLGVK